jgi:lipoprotein-anchoring transpeptidase ErfK/SrfK
VAYGRRRRKKSHFMSWVVVLAIAAGGGWWWYKYRYLPKTAPAAITQGQTTTQPHSTMTMIPPGGLTPPLEAPAAEPPSSQPATTRPAAAGLVQAIPMAPVDVPPTDQVEAVFQAGMEAWQSGDVLTARNQLNRVLHSDITSERQDQIRGILTQIAEKTLFSPEVFRDDPLVTDYLVVSGDSFNKIARQYNTTEQLIARINGAANTHFVRAGRRLKVINGPFHVTVRKAAHAMHVYLQNVYVCSYKVALGTDGSTPTGKWKVTDRLTRPTWTNPRTGQRIAADDPQNPLGKYWIALEGIEGKAMGQSGYGIHGTIDENSIGTDASMGCVRMANNDIEVVYSLLVPGSTVTVTD